MQSPQDDLTSDAERRIQNDLKQIFAEYLAAAHQLRDRLAAGMTADRVAEASRQFEDQSRKMMAKAMELSGLKSSAQQELLTDFNRTFSQLQLVVVGAIICMVAGAYLLARSVYRDTIAPLRRELVHSRSLLERQQKLASLGVLAAGVAHEIRNPLTAIKARLFTLRRGLKGGSREQADAEVIDQEINRLERIVKDFLLFARPSAPLLERLPVAQPLLEIEQLMRPQVEKAGVQLVLEPAPDLHARMDLHQIKQVLINLVQNAAEATPAGGRVTLRARRVQAKLDGAHQSAVSLEVEDTGKGIPEEAQKQLFDPFFSTKEGGTGLGLSIAARMVEKHGGVLNYQTRVNHGTLFAIILPESRST
jgi:signal transduction histidine kinase